jgi:hypothetical protein
MYFSAQRNQRIAARLFKHIEDTTTDRLDALLDYDLSIYTSPEIAQLERQPARPMAASAPS